MPQLQEVADDFSLQRYNLGAGTFSEQDVRDKSLSAELSSETAFCDGRNNISFTNSVCACVKCRLPHESFTFICFLACWIRVHVLQSLKSTWHSVIGFITQYLPSFDGSFSFGLSEEQIRVVLFSPQLLSMFPDSCGRLTTSITRASGDNSHVNSVLH